MAEITNELIYEVLKQVQTAQGYLRGEVSHINRRLGSLAENCNPMGHEIQTIRDDMRKLRSDVEIIAAA